MILKRADWDFQIYLDAGKRNYIIIGDVNLFFRYQRELLSQNRGTIGEFTIRDIEKELNMESEVEIICDPVAISLNTRKNITHLHKQIVKEGALGGLSESVEKINRDIIALLNQIRNLTLINYEYETDIGLDDFVKWYDIHYTETIESPAEIITKYLDLIKEYTKIKVVFFFHSSSFLSKPQLDELYQHLLYLEITPVFFERSKPDEYLSCISNLYTIDSDLCYNEYESK